MSDCSCAMCRGKRFIMWGKVKGWQSSCPVCGEWRCWKRFNHIYKCKREVGEKMVLEQSDKG